MAREPDLIPRAWLGTPRPAWRPWRWGFALTVLAVAMLVTYEAPPSARYLFVTKLVAELDQHAGHDLKVHGYIKAGSVVHLAPDRHHFVLFDSGAAIAVASTGAWSPTLRDEAEVIVYGRLAGPVLVGTAVIAKCATRYDAPQSPDLSARYR